MCSLGCQGNLVGFDWNDLPVGRKFDCKFLKKIKSPPYVLPPPPAGITLIGALAWKRIFSFLSAPNVRLYCFSDLNLTVHHYVQSWPSSWGTNGRNGWVRSIRIAENGYRYLLVQMVLKRLHDKPNQILGSYDQICTLGWSISYEFTVYMQKFNGNTFKHWCNSGL